MVCSVISRHELQLVNSKWCSVHVQLERLAGVASWRRLAGLFHCVGEVRVFSPVFGVQVAYLAGSRGSVYDDH